MYMYLMQLSKQSVILLSTVMQVVVGMFCGMHAVKNVQTYIFLFLEKYMMYM